MPRTRSTRKTDNRTPMEKLQQIDSKIDLYIFFQYYDGINTNGAVGFDVSNVQPGSTKHWTGIIQTVLTKGQFRSKGKKLAELARLIIEQGEVPPLEIRPQFSSHEVEEIMQLKTDTRTVNEKLQEVVDPVELFVFFKYYDGYKTRGEFGFSESAGPPGSINHMRIYMTKFLESGWNESQFRSKGKILACLAKDCLENNVIPPESLRPDQPKHRSALSIFNESLRGGF